MTGYLLDVNVLLALLWPSHVDRNRAKEWFHHHSTAGWATCPFTEAAFVRIASNPAFSTDAVAPEEGVKILELNLRHPHHQFWEDDVGFAKAVQPFKQRIRGHQQVTDAYLLGLALHKKGKLVSLDRGVLELLPTKEMQRDLVVTL